MQAIAAVLALSFGIGGGLPRESSDALRKAVELAESDSCGGAVLRKFGVERNGPPHLIFQGTVNNKYCPRRGVLASTTRSGAVVHLCMPAFNFAIMQEYDVAMVALVHELLHTQGLGEAPVHEGMPTSLEISRTVRDVCNLQSSETYRAFGK